MGKPIEFMKAHNIAPDEVWEVRRGGAWAVKHVALERVATKLGIRFDDPKPLEARGVDGCAALIVTGRLGERAEWSIGEAAPSNNKNAYPFAMAEKRGKDRVILKLLNSHGALYSEAEADDFAPEPKRQNPHVTRPEDIVPEVEYDDDGHPVDNVPLGNPDIVPMSKAQSRPEYAALQIEMRQHLTEPQLKAWGDSVKDRVASIHSEWQAIFRGQYADYRDDLRKGKAA